MAFQDELDRATEGLRDFADALERAAEQARTGALETGVGGSEEGAGSPRSNRGSADRKRKGLSKLDVLSGVAGFADEPLSVGVGAGLGAGAAVAGRNFTDIVGSIPLIGELTGFKATRDIRAAKDKAFEPFLDLAEAGIQFSDATAQQNIDIVFERQKRRLAAEKRLEGLAAQSGVLNQAQAESPFGQLGTKLDQLIDISGKLGEGLAAIEAAIKSVFGGGT